VKDYAHFKTLLKERVRRTSPSRAGLWTRYLEGNESDLNEYVVSLCYSFLNGSDIERETICRQVDDDDVVWFFEKFVNDHTKAIQRSCDNEALILGLVALAIIGLQSDPRDISLWAYELYRAAYAANISGCEDYFHKVGSLADQRPRGSSIGSWSVGDQIKSCPERNKRSVQEELTGQRYVSKEVHARNSGLAPLMQAALVGNLPALFDLIRRGEDVNLLDDGASALAFAAFGNQKEAVEMLINAGARLDVRPHRMSLIAFAQLGGASDQLLAILKNRGAKG
jgi:hypothetical protein